MQNLQGKKIIITGAAGGIGVPLCSLLSAEGANLVLLGSNEEKLQQMAKELGKNHTYLPVNLSTLDGVKDAAAIISEMNVDILINLAGISYFGSLGKEKFADIAALYHVNLIAPTLLTQAVLPEMVKKGAGQIVNIGSIFGSINFPFFTSYCASKAGLRGFSESLRRELNGSGVKVSYIAPRAVKTPLNDKKVVEFLQRTKSAIDDPQQVAKKILQAIKAEKNYYYFGFAESKFVRVNYLFPGLVDKALQKQSLIAQEILAQ